MDVVNFAQRHQEQILITKADNFSECGAVTPN
jgi:hypothetical protein